MTIAEVLGWIAWGILALAGVALYIAAIRDYLIEEREKKRKLEEAQQRKEPPFTTIASGHGHFRGHKEWWADRADFDRTTDGAPLRPGE